jgi:hypothetical protein
LLLSEEWQNNHPAKDGTTNNTEESKMATPMNAPYKVAQRAARNLVTAVYVYRHSIASGRKSAIAVRDGKLNKKSGRRLATSYA